MATDILHELGPVFLGSRLKRLGERMQAGAARVLAEAGLELQPALAPLLAALDRGPMSVGALVEAVGSSQPGITRAAGQLVALGLVRSERGADRRRRTLSLTPEGEAAMARIRLLVVAAPRSGGDRAAGRPLGLAARSDRRDRGGAGRAAARRPGRRRRAFRPRRPRLRRRPRRRLPRHQRRMDHRDVPDGAGGPRGARATPRADRRSRRRDPVRRGARARNHRHLRATQGGARRVRADQDGGAGKGARPQGGRVPARGDDRPRRGAGRGDALSAHQQCLRARHPSLREARLRPRCRRSWRATAPATNAATSRCAIWADPERKAPRRFCRGASFGHYPRSVVLAVVDHRQRLELVDRAAGC